MAVIDRIRPDAVGTGQHLFKAAAEVCARIVSRANEATVRWVPAHQGVAGNETAD